MHHARTPFLPLLLSLLAGCGGGTSDTPDPVPITNPVAAVSTDTLLQYATVTQADAFADEMGLLDGSRWFAADWNNGGYFLNGWHPGQLQFQDGRLAITLEADTRQLTGGQPAVSGEYRSFSTYGHGTFTTRLIASAAPGAITAFFLYTGPAEGTRHDEIDIEIKGDDPTKLSINYWTDGVQHPTVVDLGFDASAAMHDYAFRWTPSGLQWFVDGRLVHEESGARGPLPQVPGHLVLSLWGATGAEPWSSTYQVGSAPTRMVVDRVAYSVEPGETSASGRRKLRNR